MAYKVDDISYDDTIVDDVSIGIWPEEKQIKNNNEEERCDRDLSFERIPYVLRLRKEETKTTNERMLWEFQIGPIKSYYSIWRRKRPTSPTSFDNEWELYLTKMIKTNDDDDEVIVLLHVPTWHTWCSFLFSFSHCNWIELSCSLEREKRNYIYNW